MNNRGFTLVELLAALVILGLLMAIAVPNIVGLLKKARNDAYIEDAKKLVSLAEYNFRADSSMVKPGNNECIVYSLEFLDDNSFTNAPSSGKYFANKSFVLVKKYNNNYIYYVQIMEQIKPGDNRGVTFTNVDNLNASNKYTYIKNTMSNIIYPSSSVVSNFSVGGVYCNKTIIKKVGSASKVLLDVE